LEVKENRLPLQSFIRKGFWLRKRLDNISSFQLNKKTIKKKLLKFIQINLGIKNKGCRFAVA
jgi:hypothetical protein